MGTVIHIAIGIVIWIIAVVLILLFIKGGTDCDDTDIMIEDNKDSESGIKPKLYIVK